MSVIKDYMYLTREHPVRLAHRGSCVLWPENTIAAFQGAFEAGCQYMETDLHVTADNVIVTFHDDRLERVTNGKGLINEWKWEDLKQLDAAYNFKPEEGFPLRGKGVSIPSLEDVMKTFPDVYFNLDLKQKGIEKTVAEFIDRHHYHDRVLIAGMSGKRTRKCHKRLKRPAATSAGFLEALFFWLFSRFKLVFPLKVDALQVPPEKGILTVVDKKFVDTAHKAGIQVHAWIINEPEEMRRLLDLGVDGIVTDRIDSLNRVLST